MSAPDRANIVAAANNDARLMRRRNKTIVIFLALLGAGAGLVLGLMSDGVHHDDDLTHFLFARWSWWYPGYLTHVWGRPGFTLPMALVSGWFDRGTAWHLARAFSACITLASALLAAALARRMGLRYWPWVVALCYFQPLNMVLSYTTLTENFTGLYLIASLYLLHRQRCVLASVVFSLALVSRLETVILLPVWGVVVWGVGRSGATTARICLAACMASLWAPIAQNLGHFAFFGTWPASAFLHPSGSTEYLATGPLAFLPPLLLATTPIVAFLSVFGAAKVIRRGHGSVIALAGIFLATHWLIKWFGVFASGGFARFVVAVSPLLAIAAAAGMETIVEAFRRPGRGRKWVGLSAFGLLAIAYLATRIELHAGRLPVDVSQFAFLDSATAMGAIGIALAAACFVRREFVWQILGRLGLLICVVVSVSQFAIMVRPLRLKPEHAAARDTHRFVSDAFGDAPVFAANPWIAWWSGHVEDPRAHKGARLLSSMPVGTVFIWDSIYSGSDFHQLELRRFGEDPSYQFVRANRVGDNGAEFRVFVKIAETRVEAAAVVYPVPLTLGRGEVLGVYYQQEEDAETRDAAE